MKKLLQMLRQIDLASDVVIGHLFMVIGASLLAYVYWGTHTQGTEYLTLWGIGLFLGGLFINKW